MAVYVLMEGFVGVRHGISRSLERARAAALVAASRDALLEDS